METQGYRLMTIFAHPDDETFGCSGVMARIIAQGGAVAVVCATRGEAGEIADPALATPATLPQVRERELRAAMAAVGVTDVNFLDYHDGHLPQAPRGEAIGRIVALIRRFKPDIIVTFNSNGIYGHPDHMVIHMLAQDAIRAAADPAAYPGVGDTPWRTRKVYYNTAPRERFLGMRDQMRAQGQDFVPGGNAATIPVEVMGEPERAITTYIKLTDEELRRKIQAMRAHATQMPPNNPFSNGSPEQLREIMGTEVFILAPPPLSAHEFPTPETDLFAGLG